MLNVSICRPYLTARVYFPEKVRVMTGWKIGLLLARSKSLYIGRVVRYLYTVGFWWHTIHKKFLWRFDTIFGLKMIVKSGLEKLKIILEFHDGLQSCCPVQKNLPRKTELAWQVSRYLWVPPWNFKINFSRPLFIIILSQNWCQISVRIFCVPQSVS